MSKNDIFDQLVDIISQRCSIDKKGLTRQTVLPLTIGMDNTHLLTHFCVIKFGKSIAVDVRTATIGDFVDQLAR